MSYYKRLVWIFIILLLAIISSVSSAETSGTIFNKIQATFDTITTLRTTILQTNIELISHSTTIYSGTIYFQNPDKLRIHYTKPTEQIVLYDGSFLWMYTAELKQITKQNLNSASIPVPLFCFTGVSNIDRAEFRKKYSIKLVKSDILGTITTYRIRIKPKSNSAKNPEMTFWFNESTFLPIKAKIIEPAGINVTLTFSGIEQNTIFPMNIFTLSVPPDVEVIDLTSINK